MANTETSMARVVLLAVSRAAQDVPENCSVDSQKVIEFSSSRAKGVALKYRAMCVERA